MEIILYISAGLIVGLVIGWLISKAKASSVYAKEKAIAHEKYSHLEKEHIEYKATQTAQMQSIRNEMERVNKEFVSEKAKYTEQKDASESLHHKLTEANAELKSTQQTLSTKTTELEEVKKEAKDTRTELNDINQSLATEKANNTSLHQKLETQKADIVDLNKKFTTEFENIASKILDIKSEKFTELNKTNLKNILEPLGVNITEFKSKVDDVYNKESKERFSLGEKVKELTELNQQISTDAKNLTRALKGEAKTQGRWGEMILETILEKSGLRKGEEFFMEHQLYDASGKPLRSEAKGTKMRPDAVVKYPDARHVIIDSKVSLTAFTRLTETDDSVEQSIELASHLQSIKNHINDLNQKAYDDYDKAMDFVMMFVPSEAAFITAMQADPNLWHYAYDRRILLISPTNLIAALKLISDLWKRENHNRNAKDIAERGAKLYDKFVGFVANLEEVGDHLTKAQVKYTDAYKQLSTGNDNLITQATKLKALGLKNKKHLPEALVEISHMYELDPPELIEEVEIEETSE